MVILVAYFLYAHVALEYHKFLRIAVSAFIDLLVGATLLHLSKYKSFNIPKLVAYISFAVIAIHYIAWRKQVDGLPPDWYNSATACIMWLQITTLAIWINKDGIFRYFRDDLRHSIFRAFSVISNKICKKLQVKQGKKT